MGQPATRTARHHRPGVPAEPVPDPATTTSGQGEDKPGRQPPRLASAGSRQLTGPLPADTGTPAGATAQCPETTARECPDITGDTSRHEHPDTTGAQRPDSTTATTGTGWADSLTPAQQIMHARLAVMSQPRHDDNPRRARLREVLRDRRLMAHVVANVDQWPPLSDEQRAEIAALLHHHRLDQ